MSAALLPPDRSRVRLNYLDGIRALAALYVTVVHIIGLVVLRNHVNPTPLMAALLHGRAAVGIFIVLSGYSLMLPLAAAADGKLRGGAGQFLLRRARRILPPYYAALGVTMLSAWLWQVAFSMRGDNWVWIPEGTYTLRNIALHLSLLHNFSPRYITAIDPPTWSVAVEWQIYFVFALLLIPIWQRFGNRGALLFSLIVGLTPMILFPASRLNESRPSYVLLFALGMLAANINFAQSSTMRLLRERMAWGRCAAALAACFVAMYALAPFDARSQEISGVPLWVADVLVGVTTACCLVYFTSVVSAGQPQNAVLRLLNSRPLVQMSVFSYSLYLAHYLVVDRATFLACQSHLSLNAQLAAMFLVGLPAAVGFSYLFHMAFERRFLMPAAHPAPAVLQAQRLRADAPSHGLAQA